MQHWLFLAGAIFLEVGGTIAMKVSDGLSKATPSIIMTVCYIASLALLTLALKKIELSIAYAIWAGVGTALIAIVGILYFKEPATAIKLLSLALIIAGVVGLNLSGAKG
jgi:small multidrug resistance pump